MRLHEAYKADILCGKSDVPGRYFGTPRGPGEATQRPTNEPDNFQTKRQQHSKMGGRNNTNNKKRKETTH